MNMNLFEYLILNAMWYTLFFGCVSFLLPLHKPPYKFISDGTYTYSAAQSTSRVGNLTRLILKFLLYMPVALFTNFPSSKSLWTQRKHLGLQSALSQYWLHVDIWAMREQEECKAHQQHDVFVVQHKQKSSARIVDFDNDAFDVTTDN